MSAEGGLFFFFLLSRQEKILRSVAACDYAYSSKPAAADVGSCQVSAEADF